MEEEVCILKHTNSRIVTKKWDQNSVTFSFMQSHAKYTYI